ncbi:1844_t:CDS:1, partial [Racocetra persica]
MSFYCFETRQDRTLAPYPPPECSQQLDRMSPSEIVDHIIATNIDPSTLVKIEKQIAVPLRQLISPRENRRRRCIPRPQNNFVLYRRNFHAVITKERGHAVAKNFKLISNEAAKNWSEESNEVKQLYELIADCAKKVHDCTYPQYVYQPKHKSSKKGNNTIFREVTMDTCKQRSEKSKSDRNSKTEKTQTKPTKSSTKSAAASMTLTMTTLLDTSVKTEPSITSSFKASPQSERETSIKEYPQQHLIKEWRWAHYGQPETRSVHNDQYK